MIKIGDKVKVTGTGGIYTTYQKMADLMGSKLFKKNLYPAVMEFEVIEKHKHITRNKMVYLLKNNEGEFLFTDEYGDIVVITKPRTKTEFVRVEFEKLSDLVLAYESGDEFYYEENKTGYKYELDMHGAISMHKHSGKLYRKVETEIIDVIYDAGCRFVGKKLWNTIQTMLNLKLMGCRHCQSLKSNK